MPIRSPRPVPKWDICTMAWESPSLVLAWTAHHLSLGVHRIHLILDGRSPEVDRALAGHPRVDLTHADAGFWTTHFGHRPARNTHRQMAMLERALARSEAAFVFHIDIDEVLVGQGTLAEALATVPVTADCAIVQSAERVHLRPPNPDDIFCGGFRRQAPPRLAPQIAAIDGPMAPYLDRGMTAYASGKSAFRTGRHLTPGIHFPRPFLPRRSTILPTWELLHFDGLTKRHWIDKRLRLLATDPANPANHAPFRMAQLQEVARLRDRKAVLETFYMQLKHLDRDRAARLDQYGLLIHDRFDPRPALAQEFPAHSVDLSVATFDAFDITDRRSLTA